MNSRTNSGRGFLVPPGNDLPVRSPWMPLTPGKPILPRSNGLPVENHGNDQLGSANWHDGIGIPSQHFQQEMNPKGVAQNFNLTGKVGQNGSYYKLGGFPPEKGGFSRDVGSYSEAFGNGNAAWSNNPLAEVLGIKNAETTAPENGVLNESVQEVNAPAILNSYSQVDSSWTEANFTNLLLGGENPIPSSSQWIDADSLPQLPMDEFPIPLRPSYNLNSPPRSEADATSSTTNSFPFAPVTPDHAKQFESRRFEMLNFSVDESSSQEKDKPENLLMSTGSGGIENHSDELLQNIVDSSSAAVSTVFKEKDILEQEGDQGIDLNKTPQQKPPKRRKHRPKVIVEGKPKRKPKPATPKNTNFKENPSGKRKYVRKKSLKATGNQQTDATKEVTVPTSEPKAKPCKRRLDFEAENDTKGESQGNNHQVEIHQGNRADFNLNLDSQTTELGTGTRIINGAESAAITAHNAYVAEKPQARGTFNLNHSINRMPAESIQLPQGYAPVEPPAAINHNTLNTIARTVNMTTLSPYQNNSKNNYSQGQQHLQGELNRNISQANTHKNLEQTKQKTWQSTLQRNLPNLSEKRGLKRDYDKATEQAGPSAENLRGSQFLCKEIYQVDDHNSNGSSYGTECSETHKKKGTENGLHTVGCSTSSVIVNGDGSRQAITEDRNRVYTNSYASLVNAMNSEGDKISKRAKNGVNNTRGDCPFYSRTVAHIMQQQLVASEHRANTDRMAEKRSSGSTQGHNITTPTAMTKFNLPSSTPSRATTSVYEQEMEIFHAKMSVKGHKMAPTSSIQVSPGINKVILHEHKDAWHGYQQYHMKDRGLPEKQKDTVTVDEITSRLKGLQITGRNRKMNERDQQALVPYKGDGTMVPYNPIKKRKPRPKVDLDPETNRMWKLLMGKEGSEGIEVEDKDKEKWWEEERKVFRGRADSFIARMHLVQGDRRFSQWKGSVVDSVIGVFLTQNVSDHLSSSAFMSLAARFPYQSPNNDQTCYQSETSMMGKELVIHKLPPGGTIKFYETLTRQPGFYQASVQYHNSSGQRTEGPISGTRRTSLETERNGKNESCSGSNSESEDSTHWGKSVNPQRPLPHMGRNAPFQEIHSPATWSSCFNDSSDHWHNQSEYISSNKEIHRLQNFNNLKNSSSLTQPIHCNIPHMQGPTVPPSQLQFHMAPSWVAQKPNCFETLRKESTSPLSTTASGITEGKGVDYMRGRIGLTAERISKTMVPQNGVPIVPAPTVGPYAFLNKHLTPGESGQQSVPHTGKGQHHHNNHQQKKSRTFQLESTWVKEPMRPTEAVATGQSTTGHQVPNGPQCTRQAIGVEERIATVGKQKFLESRAVESNVKDQVHFSGEVTSGMSANISNARKGKAEEDKTKLFDWDSLRKKVQPNGRRKERSKDAMDSLDYETLRRVGVSVIADCIKERGMNNMLADRIKDFLDRMVREHGSIDLEWLRDVPPDQAKEYLLSIRGLGLKSVECVRLLTLHHLAFPVDTNVGRIAVRLGWVPLQPLPESLQLHLLELYPVLESIQKYLWPRLCKLDQRTLYELHYQLITFGKVFCTKSKPNCNACPLRAECRHFASAFASARLALPGPEEKSIVSSANPIATDKNPAMEIKPMLLPPAVSSEFKEMESIGGKCEPIIEEPTTPEPETIEVSESDIEDAFCDVKDVCYGDPDEIPTIKLNIEEFTQNLHDYVGKHMELQEGDMSKALVALNPKAAYIPTPKLKYVCRLRTEHQVYELPDSHSLLEGLDKREPDDPSPYLLAIWTPGETADSIQPPERRCGNQESGILCNEKTCFSCNSVREANSQTVRGTLLIPCRTAMKGSFPLNGTYFQVNEVFADYESSLNPMTVPRAWIWNLPRRTVYFGTSVSTIFKGLPTEGIQYCFWRGFVCVRGFDRQTRAPKPLISRLHVSPTKLAKTKTEDR